LLPGQHLFVLTFSDFCILFLRAGGTVVSYQGQQIDLTPPWRRVSMTDIVMEACGVDFYPFILSGNVTGARHAAVEHARIPGELLAGYKSTGEILNAVFEHRCESSLIQPTFITDHPVEVSPLAKPHRTKAGLVERFEMFMVGREHANAFSELTDPIDQRARFNRQVVLLVHEKFWKTVAQHCN
jgi:lysyl-tRNA synthetase class 2